MSLVTPHQTDLTTFCKFKREHKLRRALHLLLNRNFRLYPIQMNVGAGVQPTVHLRSRTRGTIARRTKGEADHQHAATEGHCGTPSFSGITILRNVRCLSDVLFSVVSSVVIMQQGFALRRSSIEVMLVSPMLSSLSRGIVQNDDTLMSVTAVRCTLR